MHPILLICLEAFFTIVIISALHYLAYGVLKRKFSPLIATFFAFIVVGFIAFVLAPYAIAYAFPSAFYLPVIFFWLIWDLIFFIRKEKNHKNE